MAATLEALKREGRGKNEARRLRRQGRIPAVIYGGGGDRPVGIPIAVSPKELLRILHSESGANTLIGLQLDGTDSRVMVREYQLDPVSRELLHADFYRIAMDKRITVTIPVVVQGEPKGVKLQGGLLDFVHREIEVECLPADIPEAIEVDVSELMLGQNIRVRDLTPSPKWTPVSEAEMMLVHVVAPKAEEPVAAEAAVATTPAEPEVIKKGKADKEEEEEKEKKDKK
jgi:large subunit ribosomal protein L25